MGKAGMRTALVVAVAKSGAQDADDVLAAVREATGRQGVLPAHYDLVWHNAKMRTVLDDEEDSRFNVLLSCSLAMQEVDPEAESTVTAVLDRSQVVAEVPARVRERGRDGEREKGSEIIQKCRLQGSGGRVRHFAMPQYARTECRPRDDPLC